MVSMKEKGFTLIELLITVAIIGILSTVAITAYVGVTKKAARSEAYSNLSSLKLLLEQRYADSGTYGNPVGTTYMGTVAVTGFLTGFRPGPSSSYNYSITSTADGVSLPAAVPIPYTGVTAAYTDPVTGNNLPCFIATATGILGSRVCPDAANCDVFAIDCVNNKNF